MTARNYQKEMDEIIAGLRAEERRPTLLLHACCAPCTSGCFERVYRAFSVTLYFYNPNITEQAEYEKRLAELARFANIVNTDFGGDVSVITEPYTPDDFLRIAKGVEDAPEGGERCFRCYALRLGKTCEYAEDHGFDYFATTLTLSPLKSADKLNETGEACAANSSVLYLPSDFKKCDGVKRSIELSRTYGLYRQSFCGCTFARITQ